ncbi:hypothetical protein [uncultured Pseudokineococcus sp.]|uniref:hypothetical protein n=1 Tax=uncultured Pseudokineococcus sp. TaxID=1642928 RepID=UPI002639AF89|nr:hypothetical protein [uncultured Pseudokineococcus sp.]
MLEILAALAPSLFVGLLFWWVIRSMLNGDRREREALAKLDAHESQRPRTGQDHAPEPAHEAPDAAALGRNRNSSEGEHSLRAPGASRAGEVR